ncbi:DoxX family protein [Peribacillus sp. SCS-155]|uniref:DoxX family protein n=1 Tax=Peribacillus sedimenti TaxID=3115297 RepID=UPI003905B580
MTILSIVLQVLLGIMFTFFGIALLARMKPVMDILEPLHIPDWFRKVAAVVELIGGISMLLSVWNANFALFGGIWLTITMIVAIALHFRVKQPVQSSLPAIIAGLLSITALVINI